MMLIGRSSRRENLLWVTGVEPMPLIRTRLANHIRASSREQWLHQQARHMTAPTAIVPMPNIVLDRKAPSTHDPLAEQDDGRIYSSSSLQQSAEPLLHQ